MDICWGSEPALPSASSTGSSLTQPGPRSCREGQTGSPGCNGWTGRAVPAPSQSHMDWDEHVREERGAGGGPPCSSAGKEEPQKGSIRGCPIRVTEHWVSSEVEEKQRAAALSCQQHPSDALSQDPHKNLTSMRCDPDSTQDPDPVVSLLMVTGKPELTPCQTISPLCWLALRKPCAQTSRETTEVANPKPQIKGKEGI